MKSSLTSHHQSQLVRSILKLFLIIGVFQLACCQLVELEFGQRFHPNRREENAIKLFKGDIVHASPINSDPPSSRQFVTLSIHEWWNEEQAGVQDLDNPVATVTLSNGMIFMECVIEPQTKPMESAEYQRSPCLFEFKGLELGRAVLRIDVLTEGREGSYSYELGIVVSPLRAPTAQPETKGWPIQISLPLGQFVGSRGNPGQ